MTSFFRKREEIDEDFPGYIGEYEELQEIGSGQSDILTIKVRSNRNKKFYAMKIYKKINFDWNNKKLTDHIKRMVEMNNPNILKYYAFFPYSSGKNLLGFAIITDLSVNGNLKDYINLKESLNEDMKEEEIWNFMYQCMKGLTFLHEKKIYHGNIKSTNFFLTNNKTVIIGDTDISEGGRAKNYLELPQFFQEDKIYFANETEKRNYYLTQKKAKEKSKEFLFYAPELISDKAKPSYKSDIYSMGACFYEMVCRCPPKNLSLNNIEPINKFDLYLNRNIGPQRFQIYCNYNSDLYKIINEMINTDPNERKDSKYYYDLIKDHYYRYFIKDTSVNAMIRSLFSIQKLTKFLLGGNNSFHINIDQSKPFCSGIKKTLEDLERNSSLYTFHENLENVRSILNDENHSVTEELPFEETVKNTLNKLHQELNIKLSKIEKGSINSQDQALIFFREFMKKNYNSIIGDYCHGVKQIIMGCSICHYKTNYYETFRKITFDLEVTHNNLVKKKLLKNPMEFSVFDCFNNEKQVVLTFGLEAGYYCNNCHRNTIQDQVTYFYEAPKLLLIYLKNNKLKRNISLVLEIELDLTGIFKGNQGSSLKYELISCVNKYLTERDETYVSFHIDPARNCWYKSSKNQCYTQIQNYNLLKEIDNESENGIPIFLLYQLK